MTILETVRPPVARPALATRSIDLDAIGRNLRRVKDAAGTDVMAVVKADAFGHGARQVATACLRAGATWLGVATVTEATDLRRSGITAPVLAWLVDPWSDLTDAVRLQVTLSCSNVETLEAVIAVASAVGVVASIHLEIDTGLARGGAPALLWRELVLAAAQAERRGALRVTGVWSHLALASDPHWSAVGWQFDAFTRAVGVAIAHGLAPTHVHLANSAAALAHPRTRLSMVRIGAALYGIETVEGRSFGLEPALRLTSRITQLRDVSAGTGVGYGHRFITTERSTLALVPLGYADGVPRELADGGSVSILGRRHPIRGAISMDQLVVDVTGSEVALGDEVVLLGDEDSGEPTAAEWATRAGTLPHDILSSLGQRIARDFSGGRR